jgi:hypothetical protein
MNFLLAIFKATGLELSLPDKVHMSNMVIVSKTVLFGFFVRQFLTFFQMLMVFFQQALTKNSSVDGKAEFV